VGPHSQGVHRRNARISLDEGTERGVLPALVLACSLFAHDASGRSAEFKRYGYHPDHGPGCRAQQVLSDARVFLIGPTVASALTTKSGSSNTRMSPATVPRARLENGFAGVTSGQFEVLGNKQVDVDVDLGVRPPANSTASGTDSSGYKIIGPCARA